MPDAAALLGPSAWAAVAAAAYALGVGTLRRGGVGWSTARSSSFALGVAVLWLSWAFNAASDGSFSSHVLSHLGFGMLAPVLLALAAPGTLALRATSRSTRRALMRFLHSAPVCTVTHPVGATVLSLGTFLGLYFTPLYDVSERHPLLHMVVHVHVFVSGCAFAWAFVGLDPVPRRVSQQGRVLLLLLVLAVHGAAAKLLYAGYGGLSSVRQSDLERGAQLMYYGAEPVHLLLVGVFFVQWYQTRGRRLRQQRRRQELGLA